MKKTIIIISLLLAFEGCKKDSDTTNPSTSTTSTDVRDKFVGKWKRVFVVIGLKGSGETTENFTVTKSTVLSNIIFMTSGFDTWEVTVKDTKISYTKQRSPSEPAFCSGEGVLSSDGKIINVDGYIYPQTTTDFYATKEVWTKQ
jgi:hypothetical protein